MSPFILTATTSATIIHFHFDIIGLTEIFKLNEGFNYSIAGYHDILSNTRHDSDDGHGGVGNLYK